MTTITFPEGTKSVSDNIRNLVGRPVIVYVDEGNIACSGCGISGYDSVTDTAINSFCTICNGDYWIPVTSGYSISGHVRWGSIDQNLWTRGGWIPEGECKVTVEYTVTNLDRVTRSKSWLVDGKTLYLKNYQLRGIRGDSEAHGPNRIAVFLKQEER